MTTLYPAAKTSIAGPVNGQPNDAEPIADGMDTVEALEDFVGYTTDTAASTSINGRLKAVEAAPGFGAGRGPDTASAATLTLPTIGTVIPITGTTTVTSIVATDNEGRIVILEVAGACQFTDNGTTLNLKGNFVGPGVLVVECDGTNWIEVARDQVVSHDHTSANGDGSPLTNDAHDGYSEYDEIAAPGTPASGKVRNYPKSDGLMYSKDDAGTERPMSFDYATTAEIADTAATESAGASAKIPRGDHVHGLGAHNHTSGAGDGGVLTNDAHDGYSDYDEIAAPSTPASGKVRVYAKSDGKLYSKDDAGVETELGGDDGDATSLQGDPIDSGIAPNEGDVLTFVSGEWVAAAPAGGGGGGGGGNNFTMPPAVAGWSWQNQGSATATDTDAGILLTSPSGQTGDNVRGIFRSYPSTPFSIYAYIALNAPADDHCFAGIAIRAADGKYIVFGIMDHAFGTAPPSIDIVRYTNTTTQDSIPLTEVTSKSEFWLQIEDDGSDLFYYISHDDGINWRLLLTEDRADFLTPDTLGVIVNNNGSGEAHQATLRSWSTTAPAISEDVDATMLQGDPIDSGIAPNDGDVLTYDSGDGEWKAEPPTVPSHNHTAGAGDGGPLTNDVHDGYSDYAEIASPSTPSSGNSRLYVLSNGLAYAKDDAGVARLMSAGPGRASLGIPGAAPTASALGTWVNQGTATVTDITSPVAALSLYVPAEAVWAGLHLRVKTAPSTPYTVTALVQINTKFANFAATGLVWRQSSDGKIVVVALAADAAAGVGVHKYTNATTFSATYATIGLVSDMCVWLRMTDNGTNRIVSFSLDGQNFIQIHSVGRTDFLTADQVGVYVNDQHVYDVYGNFYSWVET